MGWIWIPPQGLKGEEIPLHARIVAIADTFDALTTVRPYKHLAGSRCYRSIKEGEGSSFRC